MAGVPSRLCVSYTRFHCPRKPSTLLPSEARMKRMSWLVVMGALVMATKLVGGDAPPRERHHPYKPGSLKNLSNEEIIRYMTKGNGWREWQLVGFEIVHNRLPPKFWELPPKDAALALLDVNRYDKDRLRQNVVIQPPKDQVPPEQGYLYYESMNSPAFLLRFSRDESWVIALGGDAVIKFPVPYNDARQISQVVWWLRYRQEITKPDDQIVPGQMPVRQKSDGIMLGHSTVAMWESQLDRPAMEPNEECIPATLADIPVGYDELPVIQSAAARFLIAEALADRLQMPQPNRNYLQKIDFGDRWPDPDAKFLMSEREVGQMIATLPVGQDHPALFFMRRFVNNAGNEGLTNYVPVLVELRDRVKSQSAVASSQSGKDLMASIDWTLASLQNRMDPAAAKQHEVKILKKQCAEGWPSQRISILDQMLAVDPPSARELAAKFGPGRDIGWLDAFRILCTSNAIPDEAKWMDALLEVPPGSTVSGKQALWLLVPVDDPRRFADPRIDAVLRRLAAPPHQNGDAALALYLRGHREFLDQVKPSAELMERLLEICQIGKWPELEPFHRDMIRHVQDQYVDQHDFWPAWIADIRELEPRIRELATSSPDDYENQPTDRNVNGESPLRFHAARQVAALWYEPDPVTRLKLLVATSTDRDFVRSNLAKRMAGEIHTTTATLSAEQKQDVLKFLDWCVAQKYLVLDPTTNSEARLIILNVLRQDLGWPRPKNP